MGLLCQILQGFFNSGNAFHFITLKGCIGFSDNLIHGGIGSYLLDLLCYKNLEFFLYLFKFGL